MRADAHPVCIGAHSFAIDKLFGISKSHPTFNGLAQAYPTSSGTPRYCQERDSSACASLTNVRSPSGNRARQRPAYTLMAKQMGAIADESRTQGERSPSAHCHAYASIPGPSHAASACSARASGCVGRPRLRLQPQGFLRAGLGEDLRGATNHHQGHIVDYDRALGERAHIAQHLLGHHVDGVSPVLS